MSIEAVAWALKQSLPKKQTAKLILIALANHHNESTGECYPAKRKLREAGCCDKRTLERNMKWLEANGWLKRVTRHAGKGGKGRQTSNSYLINFGKSDGGQFAVGGQIDGPSDCRRAGDGKLPRGTSLNHKNEPSAQARDENFSPEEASPLPAPCPSPAPASAAPAPNWRNRLIQYRNRNIWAKNWGPPMHAPGCLVPAELVREWDATQGKAFVEEEPKPAWQTKKRTWQTASTAVN